MHGLILAATLGLTAGISPGPLLFWTITSALRSGARAGVIVACAPLVSDLLVVTATLLLLEQLTETVLAVLGVVGGVFMGWLGVQTWREARTASLSAATTAAPVPVHRALGRAAGINLLSPHPWIAWATALGPLTLAAWRDSPAVGVAFVAVFYVGLVGAKVVIAMLVAGGRHRLRDAGYRRALRVSGALLALAGVALVVEFGRTLL